MNRPRRPAPPVVLAAVLVAAASNVLLFLAGRALGAGYAFTAATGPARVDVVTLLAFSTLPLAAGLTVVALVRRWWAGAVTIALVVAPVLELGTILVMTLPTDLDTVSTVVLALCHVVLVPVTVVALLALRTAGPRGRRPDTAATPLHDAA